MSLVVLGGCNDKSLLQSQLAISVEIHVLRCRRVDRSCLELGTSGHPRPGSPVGTYSGPRGSLGK